MRLGFVLQLGAVQRHVARVQQHRAVERLANGLPFRRGAQDERANSRHVATKLELEFLFTGLYEINFSEGDIAETISRAGDIKLGLDAVRADVRHGDAFALSQGVNKFYPVLAWPRGVVVPRVRLANRITAGLQEDAAVRLLRCVSESVGSNLVFLVAMGFQAGVGNAELKVPELQPVLDENIGNLLKRVGVGSQAGNREK